MSFYFFDLETSGFSPREDRIMQFAGQRTNAQLEPIGEPDNFYIKLTADVLPQPDAVLVHGITPQKTLSEGISEAEFTTYLTKQIFTKNTTAIGYNNIRFDNEFIRFLLWRNFSDAYEWSWKAGNSIWDLLDVTRMTRALRPDGINWPVASDGKPTNSLGYLSAVNKLEHINAHDALSDVRAAIAWARLLKAKQPQLFDYLYQIRGKKDVAALVTSGQPLVYTCGRYASEFAKTSVAVMVAEKLNKSGALMYDLRVNPDLFINLSSQELLRLWKDRSKDAPYFPVQELKYNCCPAVAPLSVLDKDDGFGKLQLTKALINTNLKKLLKAPDFGERLLEAQANLWPKTQAGLMVDIQAVDTKLYDGFIDDSDRTKMAVVRAADPNQLSRLNLDFKDERLKLLLPLYKARNFPSYLTAEEKKSWQNFRRLKLVDSGLAAGFSKRIEELRSSGLSAQQKYLLSELDLYAQSILP